MKISILLSLVALAAAGVYASPSLSGSSASTAVSQDGEITKPEDEKVSPFDESMQVLQKGQRALRGQMKDPKANMKKLMENLAGMEAAAHGAIAMMPSAIKDVPEAEQAAWMIGYKQKMTMLLVGILDMEDAALRESGDDLKTAYDAISETKKSGHEKFRNR